MGRLFNMDNKFFTFMSRVADLCILNQELDVVEVIIRGKCRESIC